MSEEQKQMSEEQQNEELKMALQQAIGSKIDPLKVRELGLAIVRELPQGQEDLFLVAAALGFATQFWHLGQTAHQHHLTAADWDRTISLSDQLEVAIKIGQRFGSDLGMLAATPRGNA